MVKKIDIEALTEGIRGLKRGSKLYHTLKTELTAIDHWKLKARGKADIGRFNQVKSKEGLKSPV